ncbi:MAG: hypothetical protein ACYDEP_04350 [Acidimicrobiales bacterium]
MSGYQATGVAMATGGTAAQVAAWVANRPSSAGTPGGPSRGLESVPPTSHVTVCVLKGVFSSTAPRWRTGPPPRADRRVGAEPAEHPRAIPGRPSLVVVMIV